MRKPPVTYTLEDQKRMSGARNYFAWQNRLAARELGRRIVEVGCGVGNFTRMLLDGRELVIAIDIEPECVDELLRRLPHRQNLRACAFDVNSPDFRALAEYRPDSCVCLNVLEHVEDDLAALQAMRSILIPQGVVVLIVPAFQALYGPIDLNLGHYRRYNRRRIARLAHAAGLRVKKIRFMNTVGFVGWWVNAHILKREAQSEGQIEFFDRYVVPVISRLEAIVHPFFGQSLFVVLEKP